MFGSSRRAQATTQSFGSSGFGQTAFGGQQRGGSRVAAYSPTLEACSGTSQPAGKLESTSAMPVYKHRSHEELRWEDYQLGDKGKVSGVVPTSLNGFKAADKDKEPAENGKQVVRANSSRIPYEVEKWWELPRWRAGAAAALVFEHGAAIGALMPKLRHSYYYTEPRLQKLAVKERAEPGYCGRVKDFVVGRYGYGSIRFIGETDVRGVDVESIVQFNNREVIVYMDETKRSPVAQGLNKPAEVTLLKIKGFDKKTGLQYTEGPKIIKYINMLKRKADDQGAKFVSYDAIKGEWKFRVDHFSTYDLGSEDEEENHCIVPVC